MLKLKTDGRRSSSGEQFFLLKEGEVLIFAMHTNVHLLAEATTIYMDACLIFVQFRREQAATEVTTL